MSCCVLTAQVLQYKTRCSELELEHESTRRAANGPPVTYQLYLLTYSNLLS